MSAEKRIPVTEERWKELHDLKQAGQTWDDLLAELVQQQHRQQLAARVREVEGADEEELTALDEL